MNIVVCIKQVPGTTEVKIDPQTNTLVREGVEGIVNPFDTYALEEGVRLKERFGGVVTVVSMGPPQAEAALREAISVGADQAILLSDRAFAGSDTLATAYVLSRAIARIGDYDLVICGKQTLDGDTGQVGPELAQRLGIPFVAYVSKVEAIQDGQMRVQRLIEEGHELMEAPLPCVMSVVKEINVPRLPSLRGMMRAKGAQIPVWTARDLDIEADRVGVAGSPTRVIRVFFPQRTRKSQMLEGTAESQVEQLVERLRETKLI
ncbi:MAG TPA: electron transfer flavoprotein subunit beta/FixA family protein [Dehalococcoidia bacterium]|nr:electron transfer flavoprotein subunit beta/FixA family protein [Dehalococcoidia bacterium]